MKLRSTVVLVSIILVAILGESGTFAQNVLVFDDLGLADDSLVTNQYPGVTFSATPGGSTRIVTATSPIFPGDPQGLYNDDPGSLGYGFTEPIIVDFSIAVSSAGAFVDFGGFGDGIRVDAFDATGGSGALLGSDSTVEESFIGVSAPGIRSVVFSQNGPDIATYLIDHVTYVPEPSSLVFLGLGGLICFGRRG